MTTFATVEDLSERLGRSFDPTDLRLISALEDATTLIRAYKRQWLSFVENETFALDGWGSRALVLPEQPVVEVCEVDTVDSDGAPTLIDQTTYRVDAGILWTLDGSVWPLGHANVLVSYDHGHVVLPDRYVTGCIQIASRLYQAGQTVGQLVASESITLGSFQHSETFDTRGTSSVDVTGLSGTERALLGAPGVVLG